MSADSRPWTDNPEFVAIYDVENSGLWDTDFYLDLALELGATHVTDIGSGTGVLAVELATHGISVTGVEPAAAMLEAARSRIEQAGLGQHITLLPGFADQLPATSSDLVVMVGHVAQYFLSRAAWDEVLQHAWRTLKPGGSLAFESQNPDALDLASWDEESTRDTLPHPDGGEYTSWLEVVEIEPDEHDGDLITCRGHNILPDGRYVTADEPLRYRPLNVLQESMEATGFRVEVTWGDWDRGPVTPESPELIFLARKPG